MNDTAEQIIPPMKQHPDGVRYSPGQFAAVALLIIFVLYQFIGGGLSLLVVGGDFTLRNVNAARIALMAAQFIFLLFPTVWLMKRQHGKIHEIISWRIPSAKEFILAAVGMVALLQIAEGYVYFQDMIPLPENLKPFIEKIKIMIEETYKILVMAHSVPEMIFVVVVAALTPAICEEILFRGLVQKNLSLATNTVKGFIITGVIFGLYHFNPFLAVPLVGLGIYFSFLRHRSQSILLPMAAHFINNALSVIGTYYLGYDESDMPSILTNDSSASLVFGSMMLFTIIFIVTIMMYVRSTESLIIEKNQKKFSESIV